MSKWPVSICWKLARTSVPFRCCWGTRASAPRRATPRSHRVTSGVRKALWSGFPKIPLDLRPSKPWQLGSDLQSVRGWFRQLRVTEGAVSEPPAYCAFDMRPSSVRAAQTLNVRGADIRRCDRGNRLSASVAVAASYHFTLRLTTSPDKAIRLCNGKSADGNALIGNMHSHVETIPVKKTALSLERKSGQSARTPSRRATGASRRIGILTDGVNLTSAGWRAMISAMRRAKPMPRCVRIAA